MCCVLVLCTYTVVTLTFVHYLVSAHLHGVCTISTVFWQLWLMLNTHPSPLSGHSVSQGCHNKCTDMKCCSSESYVWRKKQRVLRTDGADFQALFVVIGCYYVYNLEYSPKASSILFLFQDYMYFLRYPDSVKSPPSLYTLLYFLTLRNICASTISETP